MGEQAHLEAVIAGLIADGATGALEVRSEKKRWLFFFAGGALVFTRSNLKSEQGEAIREKLGDLPSNEVVRLQAVRRLRNVFRTADAKHEFHDDAHPPQITPVNAISALHEAVGKAFTPEQLEERVAPLLSGYPAVVSDLGGLGFEPALEAYLQGIDGGRLGADVVEFAPVPPPTLHAALYTLWLLRDLRLSAQPLDMATVVPVGTPTLDADDLFSSAISIDDVRPRPAAAPAPSAAPPAPVPAAESKPQPRPAPPAPSPPARTSSGAFDLGALLAETVAAADEPADQPAAPPPAAPPTPAAPAPAPAAARPAPPTEHPLAGQLQILARRVRNAENHFDLLGVQWDAPPDEFRRAYTNLARELHPDRYHDGPPELRDLATELFDRVRLAWEVLGNDEKRAEYIDVAIHGKKSAEEQAMDQLNAYWAADDAFKKGLTIFRNGRVLEAHEFFRKAAEAVPEELEFQAYYGYTTFAMNQRSDPQAAELGVAILRDVLERNKNQERQLDSAWALLGRAYREQGQVETARRALVQALRINPANDMAVREMRRLEGSGKGGKDKSAGSKVGSFFAGLFGRK